MMKCKKKVSSPKKFKCKSPGAKSYYFSPPIFFAMEAELWTTKWKRKSEKGESYFSFIADSSAKFMAETKFTENLEWEVISEKRKTEQPRNSDSKNGAK